MIMEIMELNGTGLRGCLRKTQLDGVKDDMKRFGPSRLAGGCMDSEPMEKGS